MSGPEIDVQDSASFKGKYGQYSTSQEVAEDGTMSHRVTVDTDKDGIEDASAGAIYNSDGTASRTATWVSKDGMHHQREANFDEDGNVTNISEFEFDAKGKLRGGRVDNDGDGVIDEITKVDSKGKIETFEVTPGGAPAQKFDFAADGEWSMDADGDGIPQLRSRFSSQAKAPGIRADVDLLENGKVFAHEGSTMSDDGTHLEREVDTNKDGHFDTYDQRNTDAEGNRDFQTHSTLEYDPKTKTNKTVSWGQDVDGDGTLDDSYQDFDRDGDLDRQIR